MKYKGSNLNGRDIATIELLDEIRAYFDEGGAALNALALGGVAATAYATTRYVDDSIAEMLEMTPELKETIDEITQAIKDNQDIIGTLENSIAVKANQSDLDDAVSRIANIESDYVTSAMLNGYLPSSGGTIDWLDVDTDFYAYKATVENLLLVDGDIQLEGRLTMNADHELSLGQENRIYGNQGGLYIISEGDNIVLDSRDAIIFSIENEEVCSFDANDMSVYGNLTIKGDIDAKRDVYVGRTIYFTQDTHIGFDEDESLILSAFDAIFLRPLGGYVSIDGDLYANTIYCGRFQDQSFSFYNGYGNLLLELDNTVTIHKKTIITGDLEVTGNIKSNGTVASGGKAEEGDSALADLEERVARLESLIS